MRVRKLRDILWLATHWWCINMHQEFIRAEGYTPDGRSRLVCTKCGREHVSAPGMKLTCKLFGHDHCMDEDIPLHCIRCGMGDGYYAGESDAYYRDAVLINPLIWAACRVEWLLRWPFAQAAKWNERRKARDEDIPF